MINDQTLFLSLAAGLFVAYLVFPLPDIILTHPGRDESAGAGGKCLHCHCEKSEEEVPCDDL